MRIKFVLATLVILLTAITIFVSNAIAESGSVSDDHMVLWVFGIAIVLIVVGLVCFTILSARERAFLKKYRGQLSSEDPNVLLELSEKCDEFLKNRSGYSTEVIRLSHQAKTKGTKIQKQIDYHTYLEAFKAGIAEDGSHPRVISTFKEHMHNPDSFQHVSSEYENVEIEGKHYYKITMACRGTNTFGALVLHSYFFLFDENNQISLVGSSDNTESSSVNTEKLTASINVAVSAVEGVASIADLLSIFSSDE